jgi:hypothetical protein
MANNKILIAVFSALIMFGIITGFLYSINLNLTSDTVVPGIVAREIFEHGNFQFNYPIYDSYLFTDIYTFHLIPQFISNYDANVLRLTAFAVFLLVVFIFSYIIFIYTDIVKALIFAALITNLNQYAYPYFINPEFHVGTLLATGILLLLCDPLKIQKTKKMMLGALLIFAGLIAFSDAILFAFFIFPYAIYYFIFERQRDLNPMDAVKNNKERLKSERLRKEKNGKMDLFVGSLLAVTILATIYKFIQPAFLNNVIPAYVTHSSYNSLISNNLTTIISNFQQYFLALSLLISMNINNILTSNVNIIDIIIAILLFAVVIYSFTKKGNIPRYLKLMMILSIVTVFMGFTIMSFANEANSINSRFLIYTAVIIFTIIAIAHDNNNSKLNTLYIFTILILISVVATSNILNIKTLDFQPNNDQYELIDNLETNNNTFGLSGYSDSNLITYLSKENIILREVQPVFINGQRIFNLNTWLTSNRYWKGDINNYALPDSYVIITNKADPLYLQINETFGRVPPVNISYYGDHVIGYYDTTIK